MAYQKRINGVAAASASDDAAKWRRARIMAIGIISGVKISWHENSNAWQHGANQYRVASVMAAGVIGIKEMTSAGAA